jgi:hypothetical protein
VVEFPQQNIPTSQETEIIGTPTLARRIYGPAKPGVGSPPAAETIYTVPAGMRATITMLLATNTDSSSPLMADVFTLSIGPDSPETRIFSDCEVDPGIPLALELALTLEEGEIIQALPSNVTLVLNAIVAPA